MKNKYLGEGKFVGSHTEKVTVYVHSELLAEANITCDDCHKTVRVGYMCDTGYKLCTKCLEKRAGKYKVKMRKEIQKLFFPGTWVPKIK